MPHDRPKATGEFHCLPFERYPVHASFLTDRGRVRAINEDSAAVVVPSDPAILNGKGVLAVVADGMGGHEAGEIASALAVTTVSEHFYQSRQAPQQALIEAFLAANAAILAHARRDRKSAGMGTTCTAAVISNGLAYTAHVGDSRIYLIRAGRAYRMTQDHSATMEMVNQGLITLAEANHHEERNVILRAMGTHEKLDVATWSEPFPLHPGDALMICSDGLYETIDDDEFGRICGGGNTPEQACAELIQVAAGRDGTDNVTVAVIRVDTDLACGQGAA